MLRRCGGKEPDLEAIRGPDTFIPCDAAWETQQMKQYRRSMKSFCDGRRVRLIFIGTSWKGMKNEDHQQRPKAGSDDITCKDRSRVREDRERSRRADRACQNHGLLSLERRFLDALADLRNGAVAYR